MPDNPGGNPRDTDRSTRGKVTEDHVSGHEGVDRSLINVGFESIPGPDSSGDDSFSVGFEEALGDDDERPIGNAYEHGLGFGATYDDLSELGVDLPTFAPLLGSLDSTEPEELPDDRPFAPAEGVKGAHALELRAESMLQYAARGAVRTGELDRTEVGHCDDNRDVVAGRDEVAIDGMLDERTGHGLVHVADDVEMNVGGPMRMHAHLEDNIIMAGTMRDEFAGGTFVTAAMSDDMVAGGGIRCTAPLDLWVHGLVGMEERPATCAADGLLFELAGTLYEREYGPSVHGALVAQHQGTVVTTMKTGFRPLMKVALGVRNLIPAGGGGGSADASPPAVPPVTDGGASETAGAVTLTAAEGGGTLGRSVAGSDDTDEIVSVVRTVESASDAADVEELQHPASTADNLDDLARVDAEGAGYRQVAEVYEQPLPLAPEQAAADPSPGSGPAAPDPARREPPPLDRTAPGTEEYDFRKAYGSLHDRNRFYRQEMNLRGNFFMREYLDEIDARAVELFEDLGHSADEVTYDNYGLRTSTIYATLAEEARMTEDAGQAADIRAAMDEIEGMVHGTLDDVAARTGEFAGTAQGSQRVLDPNIDTDKLRSWLQRQMLAAQEDFGNATTMEDAQRASWERDYYDQMLKTLDAGGNPLAESGEQIVFIRLTKVDPYYEKFTDEIAAAAAQGWELIPPPPEAQKQLEVFLEQEERLVATLSDPEFFRRAEAMGADAVTDAVPTPPGPGPDMSGPDSVRPGAGGVDEPDVHPVPAADASPSPEPPVADPTLGSGSAATRPPAREPSPLYATTSGTEGYDFRSAYGSLNRRNQFYREDFNFRGNFFMREYLHELDAKAFDLFTDLGGPADAIDGDNFGYRTSSVYRNLETMAAQADDLNDANRAAELRAAMGEIEAMVDGTIAEVGTRTDEFSGVAIGSQRGPIDRNIDSAKLRRWLEDQAQQARDMAMAAEPDEARQLATWEWGYYLLLIQSLDEGGNPLSTSVDQIAVLRINQVEPYYAQFSDEAVAAGDVPRPPVEDEVELYLKLQDLLVATLNDPQFHRSAEEMGLDAFTWHVRSRIVEGQDFLGPSSLRPLTGVDIPPPLPAADLAGSTGYIDEVRDRSFARSGLAASEETLERQAARLAEGDASVRSRAPVPGSEGSSLPEPALATRRAPPDNAQAPIIDERSGRWVPEPPAEPGASPAPADRAPARGDHVSPQASDVSWDSGLRASGDPEADPAAGDADTSNVFRAPSEPEDLDPQDLDQVRHAPASDDDGSTGPPSARLDGSESEDVNPTGAVSGPDDFTTTPRRRGGTAPGPLGTTSPVTPDTPDPVSTDIARNVPGTDATSSGLYDEPVSFEGRSLGGASRSGDPKELARPLDGAQLPVEDLSRVEPSPAEPARKSILGNSDARPVSDSWADVDDEVIEQRLVWAQDNKRMYNDGPGATDSVWTGTLWSGERSDRAALREANARWSEVAAAQRTSSVSFGDDSRQLLYHVEPDATVYSRRRNVDLYRGADPPNTVDRAHAAHYVPRPGGWERTRETGFGRLSTGWNEFTFSPRERILNTLQRGEALSPTQLAALESGLESYRAAGGELSTSQYRAMVDMVSDLGDRHRHARWRIEGERGERLLQLIEMLDDSAVAI